MFVFLGMPDTAEISTHRACPLVAKTNIKKSVWPPFYCSSICSGVGFILAMGAGAPSEILQLKIRVCLHTV